MTPRMTLNHLNFEVTDNNEPKQLLNDLNLTINPGEFVVLLGANGAGKSTFFNTIAGDLTPTSGQLLFNDHDITKQSAQQRTRLISRVYQDPKLGTAADMTVAENILLAMRRGQRRRLFPRRLKQQLPQIKALAKTLPNHLDQQLNRPVSNLSGGQRQTLNFLMATIQKPELLLLDEHTSALDAVSSQALMTFTNQTIRDNQLTCLMITHDLEDALQYGNRLLVLKAGKLIADLNATEKQALTVDTLLDYLN
ncbi:ABC transporter ATP-binding protein [Latilactobacillus curvatus]|uniref:ATP-binding cassette domain-containing protein n=3 Tax=Latilactobacillus curvatus TaxID=28038 RepID=A0AAJ5RED4_LATCU|nr:ATP-binding cassette domain-containing protein [Latilactobacillus curvatus]ANJ69560.1 ABC transporter ATP-binding protein [Latilactobacillus curvatus]ANY13649.1 ABC transporter ATP-binding protein [Latilactobacillus curvatus]AOO75311.1 ABC transporter ATP-binding protein [Latilactobacillus curvatus]MCM0724217.1 ATP-binding cassette domain-containing protein [Latilactobacillus curvatus]MCM6843863.1 ATP-binding cassette domain-containing protein [Latilactobacillus curvatus]